MRGHVCHTVRMMTTRRDMMKVVIGAGAGAGIGFMPDAGSKQEASLSAVQRRRIPKSGELVPMVGLGTAVLVMRPFNSGRLFRGVGDRELPKWAAEFDCASWAQFFLKFVLGHPAVTCPIPATSKVHHMVDNMGGGVGRLPDDAMRERMVRALAEG